MLIFITVLSPMFIFKSHEHTCITTCRYEFQAHPPVVSNDRSPPPEGLCWWWVCFLFSWLCRRISECSGSPPCLNLLDLHTQSSEYNCFHPKSLWRKIRTDIHLPKCWIISTNFLHCRCSKTKTMTLWYETCTLQ